jgi:hypothetical protein
MRASQSDKRVLESKALFFSYECGEESHFSRIMTALIIFSIAAKKSI